MGANPDLETAAQLFDRAAEELEQAAKHCRTAGGHLRARAVPRGAAHAWAAIGHVDAAQELLREQARMHAVSRTPEGSAAAAPRSHAFVTKSPLTRHTFAPTL
ncbi:MAG TPA: hypothetical protein VKB10_04570 [Gaiellaceae bacterium]|nr:hypothetical protein [Gaiellaceae bacterium]